MSAQEGVGKRVRLLLAKVLDRDSADMMALRDDAPLFGSGLSLDSLTGLELLAAIEAEFGVDIAAEDLNLDSLQTVGTLTAYLASHSDSSHTGR